MKVLVFQCFSVLLVLESVILILRYYTKREEEFKRTLPTFTLASSERSQATAPPYPPEPSCERCRINVSLDIQDVDFRNLNHIVVSADNLKTEVMSRKDILLGLGDIKQSSNNVFFIESSCGTKKLARDVKEDSNYLLSARQTCAVESTARSNPGRDMYIVHTCPLAYDFLLRAPEYARRLLELRNVHILRFPLEDLYRDSPIEQLFEDGRLDSSNYAVVHASDIIRVLLLWRFGGTYIDLDFIIMRPMDILGNNVAGMQDNFIANAFLNVLPSGFGHQVFARLLGHINEHFDGTKWPHNGPIALAQVLIEGDCRVPVQRENDCVSFTVYGRDVLYPIFYEQFKRLFDTTSSAELIKSFKKTAIGVHFWNLQSKVYKVEVGSNQTYGLMADEFCPSVYRNCGPTF